MIETIVGNARLGWWWMPIVLAAGFYYFILEPLWLSPLARVPGPKLAALTRLYIIYYEFSGERMPHIHKLHLQYGDVVRIAPAEVAFNNEDALRKIYGATSEFYKSRYYELFWNFGHPTMFSTVASKAHADRKRMVSNSYSKSNVSREQVNDMIRGFVDQFASVAEERKILDVYYWFHYFTMDTVSHFIYGNSGTETLTKPLHRKLVSDLIDQDKRAQYFMFIRFRLLTKILSKVLSGLEFFNTRHYRTALMSKYCFESYNSACQQNSELGPIPKLSHLEPVLGAAEAMDHFVAGAETTGDTLTFLCWQLSKPENYKIQDKLRHELCSIPAESKFPAIDHLPYLEAVLKEGLRLFAAIPQSLPRICPEGGAEVAGYYIPAGTECSMQNYTMHRDGRVYQKPDQFIPERWLNCDQAMHRNFWPFSSGSRTCIGLHLAQAEMKMLLACIYRNYKTTHGSTREKDMLIDDQVTNIAPHGHQCELVFNALDSRG